MIGLIKKLFKSDSPEPKLIPQKAQETFADKLREEVSHCKNAELMRANQWYDENKERLLSEIMTKCKLKAKEGRDRMKFEYEPYNEGYSFYYFNQQLREELEARGLSVVYIGSGDMRISWEK